MTTMDTKEIRHLSTTTRTYDDSPYLSSDLSKPALSSRPEPPPPGEMEGCDVLYYIYQDHGNGSAKIR
jgi:hypothetical protein